MSEEELAVESVGKLFKKFTLPAVAGFIIGGLQIIIDGMFIGNGIGSLGLTSVTLVYPLLIIMMAIAMMLGIGCASRVALELGKGDKAMAHKIASDLIPMMLVVGAVFGIIGAFFTEPILTLVGATGSVFDMANDYLSIMFVGAIFFVFTMAFDPLIRNDGRPTFAMKMMIIGSVTNIILDYLFIMRFGFGMKGAAIATVIAFAISAIVFTAYFFSHHAKLRLHLSDISPDLKIMAGILKTGFPTFVMQISLAALVMSYNFMLLKYGAEVAVSSYGVIQYTFSILYMIFEGISAGVQPIIGYNYGAKLYGRVYTAIKMSILTCFGVGVLGFVLLYIFPEAVIRMFNPNDPELLATAVQGMRLFMFGIMVEGVIISAGTYFQSVNKVRSSLFIHFGKIFVFILPLLFVLPIYYGLTGVWMATPIGQYLMFAFVAIMLWKERRVLLHSGSTEY